MKISKSLLIFIIILSVCSLYIFNYNLNNYLTLNFQYPFVYLNNHLYIFGTNAFGEDLFYKSIYNIGYFLAISLIISVFSLSIALLFGILCGYFAGLLDIVLQRIYEIFISIPFIYLILLINNIISLNIISFCSLMIIFNFMPMVPYIRYLTYKASNSLDIINLKNIKISNYIIILKYLLPNITKKMFFLLSLSIITNFLGILSLSFLNLTYGFNNNIAFASFGLLINEGLLYTQYSYITFLPLTLIIIIISLLFLISQYYFLNIMEKNNARD